MNDSILLDEESYEADHVKHSIGGMGGHIFRRATHLSMSFIPWLYYWHGEFIAGIFGINPIDFVIIVVVTLIIAELIRLKIGFTIVGQRAYEAHQLSALFWGVISVGAALIFSPLVGVNGAAFGLPLILGLGIGDPVMGETRRAGKESRIVFISGLVTVYCVWLCSWNLLGTPFLFALLIPPIQVASEWPRLRWIDDNGTMVLFPLIVVILLSFIAL